MAYLQLALLAVGVALATVGYRRHRRKLLLGAAVVLFFAGGGIGIVSGFADGLHDGLAAWAR